MFNLLFSPWLRIAVLILLSIGSLGYGIHKLKQQAIAEVEAAATADVLRRTGNAIRFGDAVNTSPDRVRDPDQHRRD